MANFLAEFLGAVHQLFFWNQIGTRGPGSGDLLSYYDEISCSFFAELFFFLLPKLAHDGCVQTKCAFPSKKQILHK